MSYCNRSARVIKYADIFAHMCTYAPYNSREWKIFKNDPYSLCRISYGCALYITANIQAGWTRLRTYITSYATACFCYGRTVRIFLKRFYGEPLEPFLGISMVYFNAFKAKHFAYPCNLITASVINIF